MLVELGCKCGACPQCGHIPEPVTGVHTGACVDGVVVIKGLRNQLAEQKAYAERLNKIIVNLKAEIYDLKEEQY